MFDSNNGMRFQSAILTYLFIIFHLLVATEELRAQNLSKFQHTANAAISGYNNKNLKNVTAEQCATACINETSFLCQSFDFYKYRNICDLSAQTAVDVGGLKTDYSGNPYDHYELKKVIPANVSLTKFTHIPNSAISGHNNKQLTGVTPEECAAACLSETSFECKSFDYYKNDFACDLSSNSAAEVGGLKRDYPNNPYDHYALNSIASADRPGLIKVSNLPFTIVLNLESKPAPNGNQEQVVISNNIGKLAVITNAEHTDFFVPDGRTQPVNLVRLNRYQEVACEEEKSNCSDLNQAINSSGNGRSNAHCADLKIKDKRNNNLDFPLFTLVEWNNLYPDPGGLKVNANWFDINFNIARNQNIPKYNNPHACPCTDIYGFSVSNSKQISAADKADPVWDPVVATNFLDALIITSNDDGGVKPDRTMKDELKRQEITRRIDIVSNNDIVQVQNIEQAIGGFIILKDGELIRADKLPSSTKPVNSGSRTGIGLKTETDGSQTMYIVVIQAINNSRGMKARELALYLKDLGATDGINLDNSGSSQLIYNSTDGLVKTQEGDIDPYTNKRAYRPIPNFLQISINK